MHLHRSRIATLLVSVVSLSSCWNPFAPSNNKDFGSFTWTDGGQTYTGPKNGSAASRGGGNTFITGTICNDKGPGITMTLFGGAGSAPGTFTVGRGASTGSQASANYDDGTFAEPNAANLADDWFSDSGTLVITSVNNSRIAGTFTIVVVPSNSNPSTGTRTLAGSFDVAFTEEHLCGN